ncbi:hypothetical protein Q8F55_000221 [Vanrija albida]|uniref:Uncharacterized protein n=1 Tax=Vanrija albida TaxID=181172 RepID=A0ABR3QCM9_9TREE
MRLSLVVLALVAGRALAQDLAGDVTPDAVDPVEPSPVVATSDLAPPSAVVPGPTAAPAPTPAPTTPLPPTGWAPPPVTVPPPPQDTATKSPAPPPPKSSLTLFKPHRTRTCTGCRTTRFRPTARPRPYYTTVTVVGQRTTVVMVTAVNFGGAPGRNNSTVAPAPPAPSGMRPGAIIAVVLSILVLTALGGIVAYYLHRNRSSKPRRGPISAPVLQVDQYEGPSRPRTPLTPTEGGRDLPRISTYGTLRRAPDDEEAGVSTRPVRPSPLRKSVVYPDDYEADSPSRYSQDMPGSYYDAPTALPQPYEAPRPKEQGFYAPRREQGGYTLSSQPYALQGQPYAVGSQPYAAPSQPYPVQSPPDPATLTPLYQLYPAPVDDDAPSARRTRSGSTFGPSSLMPPLREDAVLESRWSHSTDSGEQGRAR